MSELENINMEAIKTRFADMAKNPPVAKSKKDLVADLAKDIKNLLALGYSVSQVLEVLNSNGMDLKESTLKNYLVKASKRISLDAQSENTPPPPAAAKKRQSRKKNASKDKGKVDAGAAAPVASSPVQDDGQINIASDEV